MRTRETRIKLTGYADAGVVEHIFTSSLVDVAYLDEVAEDGIYVVAENQLDLGDPGNLEWITSVIQSTLQSSAQHRITLELEHPPTRR